MAEIQTYSCANSSRLSGSTRICLPATKPGLSSATHLQNDHPTILLLLIQLEEIADQGFSAGRSPCLDVFGDDWVQLSSEKALHVQFGGLVLLPNAVAVSADKHALSIEIETVDKTRPRPRIESMALYSQTSALIDAEALPQCARFERSGRKSEAFT